MFANQRGSLERPTMAITPSSMNVNASHILPISSLNANTSAEADE